MTAGVGELPLEAVRKMPRYWVEALEKFIVRTTYYVEATSAAEAEKISRAGDAAYERSWIEEGDEAWLETVSVDEIRN